jgi:hypothetical protein
MKRKPSKDKIMANKTIEQMDIERYGHIAKWNKESAFKTWIWSPGGAACFQSSNNDLKSAFMAGVEYAESKLT